MRPQHLFLSLPSKIKRAPARTTRTTAATLAQLCIKTTIAREIAAARGEAISWGKNNLVHQKPQTSVYERRYQRSKKRRRRSLGRTRRSSESVQGDITKALKQPWRSCPNRDGEEKRKAIEERDEGEIRSSSDKRSARTISQ
ncbi:hypothetical protein C8J56DRAFT_1025118 [Mycena floridula]|nr:hypothetical protein C8J56DRAFT_1025118 [Mycena floridula]